MKIRNIEQYLEGYCPEADRSLLGTDEEPFLERIYGLGQQLDSTIRDVASFAKDSEEQLFYEFVQNAFDAKADSLCFYFDNDYLIVLNNGEPFYTHRYEHKKLPDGQLYNFLAKGKSLKAGDQNKSGEFGQGSKLLYTLISDKGAASNQSLLIKAIKQEKKGPYLVSWGNEAQLANFRFQTIQGWTPTDPYKEDPDLLVCKILMTYFPIAPGVDKNLFSNGEFIDIRKAFERLVDPKRSIIRLDKGTALIVPLGKGQGEAIADEGNIKKVLARLGGFAALTADKEKNHGRHLERILVNNQEVQMQHNVQSLFINYKLPDADDKFSYQFAFNPDFAKDGVVTLFRTLPITEARYNMGFIIDSPNFEHDSSRQRINDTKKTSLQLREAFSHLLEEVKSIQENNPERFDYLYDAIIASRPLKKEDVFFISTPFYETFSPFFQQNVKTHDGFYLPMEKVRTPFELCKLIPLSDVGITQYQWISESIAKREISRFGIVAEPWKLKDVLLKADPTKLAAWIASLSKEDYLKFHKNFVNFSKEEAALFKRPLLKTNKGNVYSLQAVLSSDNPVILYDENAGHVHLDRCLEVEYLLGPISYSNEEGTSNIGTINVLKINKQIEFYKSADDRLDVACRVLVDAKRFSRAEKAIREHVALFPGRDGQYRPFKQMLRQKPEGTILFDSFCAYGFIPNVDGLDDLFISSKKDIWGWVVENFDELQKLPDWGAQHQAYIKDIISVYKNAEEPDESLSLYLDSKGVPSTEKTYRLKDDHLDSEQYDYIAMFAETKGYPLVPYRFRKILSEAPFSIERASIGDIIGQEAIVDDRLMRCIVSVAGTTILHSFKLSRLDEDQYRIVRLIKETNYTCAIKSDVIDGALDTIRYCRISPEVCQYFDKAKLIEFELTTSHEMMESVISKIQPALLPKLLPVVRKHNEAIVNEYFNRLPNLIVSEGIKEEDLEWQVIRYTMAKISEGNTSYDYRDKILKRILFNGERLPDSIKSDIVRFNGTEYELYKLIHDTKTENELVDDFLACIPDPEEFRRTVYANKQEEQSPDDIYKDLHDRFLDIEQLRFCLDYSIKNKCEYRELEINEATALSDALEMISTYNFAGFDEYFKMKGFDKDHQVYAPKEILLEEELLPSDITTWIEKDPQKALGLLNGLHTAGDDYIAIRTAIKDNTPFYNFSGVIEDDDRMSKTIEWIVNQNLKIPFLYSDSRCNVLKDFLDRLPEGTEPLPALRFTPTFVEELEGLPYQILSFEYLDDEAVLMEFDNVYGNSAKIKGKPALKNFFQQHKVCAYTINYLTKQNLNERTRYRINTTAEKKEYKEWGTKVYKQWRNTEESEGVRIFISEQPVNIVLTITDESSGQEAMKIASRDDLYGFDKELKYVIIQHPNAESSSEMKTLEKVAKTEDFFKNPFISLQSIYVDMVEQGSDPNALDENEQKAVEMAQKLGEENIEKIHENLDTIKDIVEGLTEEELKTVAENKDKIKNLLEDFQDDDESMESKVRKTIGYIGELIYERYLENNRIEYDYAASRGVGDYDFMLPETESRPTLYVDVKTNLYSFKDEAVPLYIHKSQNAFMQKHPNEPFRIVRISLADLELTKSYERLRDLYGAEADYEANSRLKKDCQKIAKDYWRKARIEEFDAASPEYGIKIERLPRP